MKKFSSKLLMLLLILGCFLLPVFAQDEDETINIESSVVILNAAISDNNGKLISGLKESQFKIFEDGKEQKN